MMAHVADSLAMTGPAPAPGKRISLALTIGMHMLLALFLIYGISWQTKPPQTVQVELVRAVPPALTSEPPPPPRVEPPPAPRPEPQSPVKPDIAIKEKPKPPPEPKPDRLQQKLQAELNKLDKSKLDAALDKELAGVKASQKAASNATVQEKWLSQIRNKVRGNIVLPPGVRGNPEATFKVALLPSGEILSVSLDKSSGHAELDTAIERAILKSSPLPKPEQAALFERNLNLVFRPMED